MIKQCHISPALDFFAKGFRERWGLSEYYDKGAPALFVGMYFTADIELLNNHKGPKKVLFGGADIPNARRLNASVKIVANQYTGELIRNYCSNPLEIAQVAFKDYSAYQPVPLGDKIYCYQSSDNEGNRKKYRYDLLQQVISHFGKEKVIVGYHGHSEEEMREIYRQCFINLQFNPQAGFTSALEMAHMGRRSISNHPTPFSLPFNYFSDIVKAIEKISPSPDLVSAAARKFLTQDKSWLDAS